MSIILFSWELARQVKMVLEVSMTMKAVIQADGMIELPREIRHSLALESGDEVSFVLMADGHVFLIPPRRSLASLEGLLPPPAWSLTVEEMDEVIHQEATKRALSS